MSLIVADFESFYHKQKKISLSNMTPEEYLRHPQVKDDIYLVALIEYEGITFCEHPNQAPWEIVNGADLIMFNARWDFACYKHLQRQGIIPMNINPGRVFCASDMSRALWGINDLAGAYKAAYGEDLDKSYRQNANGKTGAELRADPVIWNKVVKACISDGTSTMRMWLDHSDRWNEFERQISKWNRVGQMKGVYLDMDLVERNMEICDEEIAYAEERIPWLDEWKSSTLVTPYAKRFVRAQCERDGLDFPKSMNKKNPEFIKWKATNVPRFDWLQALEDWAEAHRLLDIHKTEINMLDKNGVIQFNLVYQGAINTGRFSGRTREDG